MKFTPHPYQQAAIEAILDKPGVALWMEMGLGKTVVTLTAIDTLIYDACEVRKALIIAPNTAQSGPRQARRRLHHQPGEHRLAGGFLRAQMAL